MAGCYDRSWRVGGSSNARGTRPQFRLNTEVIQPFRCTYPLHLTDVMDIGLSSPTGHPISGDIVSPTKGTRTRTVREYEQTISELKKENFDLKLRIFMYEEANKNKNCRKNNNPDKDNTVEVNVEVNVESLRDELSYKNKLLQDALEQTEKYSSELKDLQEEYNKLKEHLSLMEDVRVKADELAAENKHLSEKVEKRSMVLKGFLEKYHKEILSIPLELRPSIESAVQAAKANRKEELSTALKTFKACLTQLMLSPSKLDQSEEKENEGQLPVKHLKEESVKLRAKLKPLEENSDFPADLNYVQDLKSYIADQTSDEKLVSQCESLEEFSLVDKAPNANVNFEVEHPAEFDEPTTETLPKVESKQFSDLLQENVSLKEDIEKKIFIIEDLNALCTKLKERIGELQKELDDAVSRLEQVQLLESKESTVLPKSEIFTQTSFEQLIKPFTETKTVSTDITANIVNELKEENLMLLLTVEEKEKEIAESKQALSDLQLDLENALNKKEVTSSDIEEFINERNELRERLALSCSVNNELIKQLQSLETFLEDLLHQRNLENSSLENITETSDFMSQLSRCLDESLKLSQVLSDHLSVCEGSRFFEHSEISSSKEYSSTSDGKGFPHLDLSKLNLAPLDASKLRPGMNNYLSYSPDLLQSAAGTGKRRWSYSSQHNSVKNQAVESVVLGTSNNEDLILLLNENGGLADVVIRNNHRRPEGDPGLPGLQCSNELRRRCWVDATCKDKSSSSHYLETMNQEASRSKKDIWQGHYMSSDSDIWSEPDRDVSLQRIGIDVKSSPVTPRSPRKSRLRDKTTTDDRSSEKSPGCNVYKVHSWSKRRRCSGGSSVRRLFARESGGKKDCHIEKNYSLLSEKYSKLMAMCNQLDKVREETSEKQDVFGDVCEELNGLMSSVSEAMNKLAAAQENLKTFNSVTCEKCAISELLGDIRKSTNRIQASDVSCHISESKVNLIDSVLTEVDDLKKQIEEPHALMSSGVDSCTETDFVERASYLEELVQAEKNKNYDLQRKHTELGTQHHALKKELELLKDTLQEKRTLIDTLKADNLKLSNHVKQLEEQLAELEKKKEMLSIENASTLKKLTEVTEENDELKLLTSDLKIKVTESDSLLNQITAELATTKEKLIELDKKCSKYESEAIMHSKTKEECLEKLRIMKAESERERTKLLETNQSLLIENDSAVAKLKTEHEKTEMLEKEKSDLSNQLLEQREEISVLKELNTQLENTKKELIEKIDHLQNEFSTSNSLSDKLSKDLNEMKNAVSKLETKCNAYEKELDLAKKSSSVSQENFIQKVMNIRSKLISSTNKLKEVFIANVNGSENIFKGDDVEISFDPDSIVDRAFCMEKLCSNIVEMINRFERSIFNVVNHVQHVISLLHEAKSAEENANLRRTSLQKQIEFKEIEILHLAKQKDTLQMSINEHLKTLGEKEKSVESYKYEIDALKTELSNYLKDYAYVEKKLKFQEQEINNLEEDNSKMKLVISENKNLISEKEKALFECQSEINNLKSQVLILTNEAAEISKQLEMQKSKSCNLQEEKENLIDELKKELSVKENSLKSCESEIQCLKKQSANFQNEINKYKEELNVKDDEITNLQERIFNLQTQMNNIISEKMESSSRDSFMREKSSAVSLEHTVAISPSQSLSALSEKSRKNVDSVKSDACLETKDSVDHYVKKIKSLQAKLSLAEKRIEILEKEKNDLRQNILSQMQSQKSSGPDESLSKNLSDLELKLEKKTAFIKELKTDLYKTYNALLDKQKEVDDLQQELSQFKEGTSLKMEDGESTQVSENITKLKKYKWELMQNIFDLQKRFYEKKEIHVQHFDKFKNHIEKLYNLQVFPLSKSESEPQLHSSKVVDSLSSNVGASQASRNLLMSLEVDIECLENLKIFLKRFFIPLVHEVYSPSETKTNETSVERFQFPAELEKSVFISPIKKVSVSVTETDNVDPKEFYPKSLEGGEEVRIEDYILAPFKSRLSKIAMNISIKIDDVESAFNSLESELRHFSEIEKISEDSPSKSAGKLLLLKILREILSVKEVIKKLFNYNASLRCLSLFTTSTKKVNKLEISDKESILSDETLALSRSESLSPISFEEIHPIKIVTVDAEKEDAESGTFKTETSLKETSRKKSSTVRSSQDSVCQRSHFSSPDLGIESDANHESSAPEHIEKEPFRQKILSRQETEAKSKPKHKSTFTSVDISGQSKESESFIVGDNLHAIGILKEYELLKQEVKESLVGIKSVLSRTGDGLHHIAKHTSPRKNLEYATFKSIKDTCKNVEVCLREAYKLVNNFWVAPCPTVEEWNALIRQKQEQNEKLTRLRAILEKREKEFKEAMEKLQAAQRLKDNMEKKISKKLVKTKKVIRKAELKLLENQNHPAMPRYMPEESSCQGHL